MERVLKRLCCVLLCLVAIPASAITKGTNVLDLLTDMEAGNAGDLVTSNLMFTASHTNGNIGVWIVSTNQTLTLTNFRNTALRGPVIVNSTPYTGSGNTKSFALDLNQNLTRQYARFIFASTQAKVSVGFSFRFKNGGASTGDLYDLAALEGGGGAEFQTLSVEQRTGNNSRISVETSTCPSGGGYKQFNDDTDYWVTMQWNKSGSGNLYIYDMATWNLYFSTNCTLTNLNCESLYIGRYDAHNGNHPNGIAFYDNVMVDITGNNFPLLPVGATVIAATGSQTDVSNAVFYTSPAGNNVIFDRVSIPAGSNVWTMDLQLTNTCDIGGAGTNFSGTVIRFDGAGQTHCLSLKNSYVRLRDMQIRGVPGSVADGWPVYFVSNYCSASNLYLQNFLSPIISDQPIGVVYNSTIRNCQRGLGRAFGTGTGQANWDAYTPFVPPQAWTNNFFFTWEDCVTVLDDATIVQPDIVTSQQGELYMVRFCTIRWQNMDLPPAFDFHGETDPGPLRGGIALQIYGNHFIPGTGGTIDKFVDIRGGMARVYSNTVDTITTANGVYMRRKDGETANYFNDQVTNCVFFANTENGSPMAINVEPNDSTIIVAGQSYTNVDNATYYAPTYPHFLRTFGPASSGGGGSASSSVPPSRLTKIRVHR